jgi:hypothetical protein
LFVVDDAKVQRRRVVATAPSRMWITFAVFGFVYSGLDGVGVVWMYWIRWWGTGVKPSPGVWVLGETIPLQVGGSFRLGRMFRGVVHRRPSDLGLARFWRSVPDTQGHAGFGLGRGKIGKNFGHRCRIWPPPRARGGTLRAGGRTHNAVYNPISTSISRFFFSYDTCFLFLSSDYQAHVNYDDFSFYYNDSKERKNI